MRRDSEGFMKISRRESEGAVVLGLSGSVQGGPDAEAFREAISVLIAEGKKWIVLDLSGVPYMNSTGVGIIIAGYTSVKNAGGKLVLLNAKDRVKSVMMVTRLLTVFESYYNEDEARRALKDKGASADA